MNRLPDSQLEPRGVDANPAAQTRSVVYCCALKD
jgi:hypothetical protein